MPSTTSFFSRRLGHDRAYKQVVVAMGEGAEAARPAFYRQTRSTPLRQRHCY